MTDLTQEYDEVEARVPGPCSRRGDTRQRILDVARRLFVERGYAGTSVRDLADELGITKAAVHYHFAAKEQIVLALLEPLIDDLGTRLDGATPGEPRRLLLGIRDVLVASGPLLSVLTDDPSVATASAGLHARLEALGRRSAEVLAGPGAPPDRLLRAHCALGAFFAGWDAATRRTGQVGDDDLEVLLRAALAALG